MGRARCRGASTRHRSLGSQQETSLWLRRTDLPANHSCSPCLTPLGGRIPSTPQLASPRLQVAATPSASPVLVAPWTVALNVNTRLRPHYNPAGSPPPTYTHTCIRAHTQVHACAWSPNTLGDTGLGTATKQQLWCPWSPCAQSGRTGHII